MQKRSTAGESFGHLSMFIRGALIMTKKDLKKLLTVVIVAKEGAASTREEHILKAAEDYITNVIKD